MFFSDILVFFLDFLFFFFFVTFALNSFLLLPPPPGVQINKGLVSDWVKQQRVCKWRWAGHVLRRKDGRWARRMLHWVPHGALEESAREHGQKWETWAEDNNAWRTDEAGFAKRAKVRGGGDPQIRNSVAFTNIFQTTAAFSPGSSEVRIIRRGSLSLSRSRDLLFCQGICGFGKGFVVS